MANRTAWVAGLGAGLTWTTALSGAEMASMVANSAVFSATTVANGTNLDQLADISVELTIGSATPAAGSFLGIYLYRLNEDGTSYGDGSFTLGTQKALTPPQGLVGVINLQSTNATTTLYGSVQGVVLPPDTFVWGIFNGSGITFGTSGNCVAKFKTYNTNLNS